VEPTLQVGRLPSPGQGPGLISNLKEFLTERPAKVRAGTPTAFDIPRFGTGLGDNLKEFFRSGPRGRVESGLLVNWSKDEVGIWQNLRDWIAPRKLPPLKTTSQPIPVPEIWSKNPQFSRVQVVSILVHVVVIAAVVILPLMFTGWMPQSVTKAFDPSSPVDVTVSPYLKKLNPSTQKAGGGGGQHDKLPATKGKAPKFSLTQFAAPVAHPIQHPQLSMTPTVVGNPNINLPDPKMANWGDPFGKSMNDSMGMGHGSGVGNGNGAGVGPGEGWNIGGGTPNAGMGGYGTPQCLYCPHAEYSDEAMKVKVQGVVELIAIITPDGRVTDVHLLKGLGLGLDEKAMEAVRTWRLKPAPGPDGKPASVRQIIEVQFQLF
jgi:periplasmic protein TonB